LLAFPEASTAGLDLLPASDRLELCAASVLEISKGEAYSLLDKSATSENQSVTVVAQNGIYMPFLIEIGKFSFSLASCLLRLNGQPEISEQL
jgi:hypothetical protein